MRKKTIIELGLSKKLETLTVFNRVANQQGLELNGCDLDVSSRGCRISAEIIFPTAQAFQDYLTGIFSENLFSSLESDYNLTGLISATHCLMLTVPTMLGTEMVTALVDDEYPGTGIRLTIDFTR